MTRKKRIIRTIDLFAGVGGFRLGLRDANKKNKKKDIIFKTIWSNQWEPSTKIQHASQVYINQFGSDNHSNIDIANEVKNNNIPDHDLLVGGFPCQDYSVARTLKQANGIIGKKGVLWWEIYKILEKKIKKRRPTKYLFLENVDRLLKSPAKQRGRDFAIMLSGLAKLGYAVEWRVINAADYGMPQRRRRIFIIGYKKGTSLYRELLRAKKGGASSIEDWITQKGVIAKAFPAISNPKKTHKQEGKISHDIKYISDNFNLNNKNSSSPFDNSGIMIDYLFFSMPVIANYKSKKYITIRDILQPEKDIPKEFYVKKQDIEKWKKLKGAKKEKRTSKSGFTYNYSEGKMAFPEPLDLPSRTIVTGEGGLSPSRFKHVIKPNKKYRRLTPIELERLCMFPDNHTAGQSATRRAFFMGNSLVVGVVSKIGSSLLDRID